MGLYRALYVSDDADTDHLASIHKVKEVFPIEGSDSYKQIFIDGNSVIVDKGVTVNSIILYFPTGSVICERFLKSNSLYNIDNYKLNATSTKVDEQLYLYDNAISSSDKDVYKQNALSYCGIFNKDGRVIDMKIHNTYSIGFAIPIHSLVVMDSVFSVVDWECLVGMKFDVANGERICWKYTNPCKIEYSINKKRLFSNKISIIEDQFRLPYKTFNFSDAITTISPYDVVDVTVKFDGVGCCVSNVLVNKEPNIFQKIKKLFGFTFKEKEYHVIYSSNKTIKNPEINQYVIKSEYDKDIYKPVYDLFKNVLRKGQSVYGEIVGYVDGTSEQIKSHKDYFCVPGEWKFMVYRVTETDHNGNVTEYSIDKVIDFVNELKKYNIDMHNHLIPPVCLYSGRLCDMYDIAIDDKNWQYTFMKNIVNDNDTFGMDVNESLCVYTCPREGLIIRVNDTLYKIKSQRQIFRESLMKVLD